MFVLDDEAQKQALNQLNGTQAQSAPSTETSAPGGQAPAQQDAGGASPAQPKGNQDYQGGFVNLEDYLRSNSGVLDRYKNQAKQDTASLRNENQDVFGAINNNRPQYAYQAKLNAPKYVDSLTPDEDYEAGWTNINRDPNAANKASGLERKGGQSYISDAEAKTNNAKLSEMKKYYSGIRNADYQGQMDEAYKNANANAYNKSLTENQFLAQDPTAIYGRAQDINSRAKNMGTEDYWAGRTGYNSDEGTGNSLDAFMAYRGGAPEAQKQAKQFSGLEGQLREKLNLRNTELGKKTKFDEYGAQLKDLQDKASQGMSMDEILKQRHTSPYGNQETYADVLSQRDPISAAIGYSDPARGPYGKKQVIKRPYQDPMDYEKLKMELLSKQAGWK